MNAFKLMLPLIIIAGLTACGLGGGNTAGTSTVPATTTNANANSKPVNRLPTSAYGQSYVGNSLSSISLRNVQVNDLRSLNINGREYLLDGYAYRDKGFIGKDANGLDIAVGNNLSYAKYGWVHDERSGFEYAFYQGNMTHANAMPTTGRAVYTGRAVGACTECDNRLHFGDVRLTANFADKQINGSLSALGRVFELGATINGNKFSGVRNGTKMDGAFFGENADEVSGVFINRELEFGGSFGAKK